MGRGVIPALAHTMLQTDALAAEFNEILNLVEIYAPFQPLDPAIVFYAPLRTTTRDLRLNADAFSRSSNAWYMDASGIYREAGINQPRFENSKLLMEPAATNKSTNYNANPDPGLTNIGGSGGTVSIVHRPDIIANAGLSDICSDGNVIELDNVGGGANANIIFNGIANNTNLHSASVWARRTKQTGTGIEVRLGMSGSVAGNTPIGTQWQRYIFTAPTSGASEPRIIVEPDFGVEVILNQFEESRVVTSPVVSQGTAGQRGADALMWAQNGWFDPAQGMCIYGWDPQFDSAPYEAIDADIAEALVTVREAQASLAFLRKFNADPAIYLRGWDGVSFVEIVLPAWNSGDSFLLATLWGPTEKLIGYNKNGGGWNWGTSVPLDGDWQAGSNLHLNYQAGMGSHRFQDLTVYNENKGTAWVEENYP